MDAKPKLLVVDDDQEARQLFDFLLRTAGYEVILAADAEQALEELKRRKFDIVVSDISLPGLSGLDLLQRVRERQLDCEVIILTAFPAVDSAIQSLRAGAVDYLTKPVARETLIDAVSRVHVKLTQARQRREALAMLEAGLKQFMGQAQPAAPLAPLPTAAVNKHYQVGPVALDVDRFVIEVDGRRIDATPSELEILHYLCCNSDRVATPQEMVKSLRGYSVEPEEATEIIRPHISNLRRKLLAASSQADVIVTVRSVGYRLKTSPIMRP